jgi:ferritin-like metal-binding protein YciE
MKNAKKMELKDLLITKLCSLYDVENEIVKAVPKMVSAATDPKLKKGLKEHLEETKGHVERLEEIFQIFGLKPKKLKTEAIRGIVKDGNWVIKNVKPQSALNAAIVRAAQYVEHYEIAGYMGAAAWARALGEGEVEALLLTTLQEEESSDKELENVGNDLDQQI